MDAHTTAIAIHPLRWAPCYRIIASRFPTIFLFERVAHAADFDALYQLEALTNPRILEEMGAATQIPREDRAFGPGASVIMAPFMYLNPAGGRFSDATFGAYYAAHTQATAIAETRYHREIFLRATHEGPMEITLRGYCADVSAKFHDIRGRRAQMPQVYDPDSYAASQALALKLRLADSHGIVYDSVRDPDGQCIAIYRPRLIQKVRQSAHLRYVWDGERIAQIYEIRPIG